MLRVALVLRSTDVYLVFLGLNVYPAFNVWLESGLTPGLLVIKTGVSALTQPPAWTQSHEKLVSLLRRDHQRGRSIRIVTIISFLHIIVSINAIVTIVINLTMITIITVMLTSTTTIIIVCVINVRIITIIKIQNLSFS